MKRYFSLIIVFSSLLCAYNHFDNVSLDIVFLPVSRDTLYQDLESVLNTAQSSVMVAMYWLTYKPFIHKLITLKQRNIDVQVILDESMLNKYGTDTVTTLSQAKIYPLISPSEHVQGIMHNKFIIIDNKMVLTGSANFTDTVLNPGSAYLNDENILIINSVPVASLYARQFDSLKKDVVNLYIRQIAEGSVISPVLQPFMVAAYNNIPEFQQVLLNPESPFSLAEKNNLIPVFPILQQAQKRARPADVGQGRSISEIQRRKLEEHGIDTRGMSYEEAFPIYGKILEGKPVLPMVYEGSTREEERATPAQLNYLRVLGASPNPGITKSQASALINRLKKK